MVSPAGARTAQGLARTLGLVVVAATLLAVAYTTFAAGPDASAAPARAADNLYPLLSVRADNHLLGGLDDLSFEASYLSAAGNTESVTITTPGGFGASVIQAAGTKLGTAGVGVVTAAGGSITRYLGSLLVMDPAAYAADPNAQACDPGTHTAVWSLVTGIVASGIITIPIAVDARGSGYRLTICLGAVQALGRQTEYVYFQPSGIFRNPARHGNYMFDGTVTPFASASSAANPASAYEFRAYEVLPQELGIAPTYNPDTRTLAVAGLLSADTLPHPASRVELYGAASSDAIQWHDLGGTVTNKDGSFQFTKKQSRLEYPYVYAEVGGTNSPACPGSSAAPGGCASESFDWRTSAAVMVVSSQPITARTAPAELRNVLLTAHTVSTVAGAPAAGFINLPIRKAGLSENLDPRTPCGGKLSDFPSLETGAIGFFTSPSKTDVLQWANRLKPGLAASVMRSELDGARQGCAKFETTDATGLQTTNRLVAVVPLPPYGADTRLALITHLTQGKQSAYYAKVLLQRGDYLMVVEVLSSASPSRTFVTQLATTAANRFDNLPTTR